MSQVDSSAPFRPFGFSLVASIQSSTLSFFGFSVVERGCGVPIRNVPSKYGDGNDGLQVDGCGCSRRIQGPVLDANSRKCAEGSADLLKIAPWDDTHSFFRFGPDDLEVCPRLISRCNQSGGERKEERARERKKERVTLRRRSGWVVLGRCVQYIRTTTSRRRAKTYY